MNFFRFKIYTRNKFKIRVFVLEDEIKIKVKFSQLLVKLKTKLCTKMILWALRPFK